MLTHLTHTAGPVSVAVHAADAAALLDHLAVPSAHVAGHSSGAAVAARLCLDHPRTVRTLALLELSLLSVPSGEAFFEQAGPAFQAYAAGDHEGAITRFLGVLGGLNPAAVRTVLEDLLPGAFAQAVVDADTFFGVELPALGEWGFDAQQAAAIECPVLSMLGSATQPLPPAAHRASRASRPSDRRLAWAPPQH